MQAALQNVEGVSSVEIDLSANKAIVKVETGKATAKQLVSAVDQTKGMAKYGAALLEAQ